MTDVRFNQFKSEIETLVDAESCESFIVGLGKCIYGLTREDRVVLVAYATIRRNKLIAENERRIAESRKMKQACKVLDLGYTISVNTGIVQGIGIHSGKFFMDVE